MSTPVVEAWVCDPPPRGQNTRYRVVRQEFVPHGLKVIRLIYEIEIVEPKSV